MPEDRLGDLPVAGCSVRLAEGASRKPTGVPPTRPLVNSAAHAWAGALERLPEGRQALPNLTRVKFSKKQGLNGVTEDRLSDLPVAG